VQVGEVANCDQSFNPQAIRIDKNTFFLKPGKQIVFFSFELDLAQASVAHHIAANADVRQVLFFDTSGGNFKEVLEGSFSCWN